MQLRFLSAAMLVLGIFVQSARGIVTSDEPGSHVVGPGESAFGMNLDGVVMVGGLRLSGVPVSICTGALISDRHVLCAAHCFDPFADGRLDSFPFLRDAVVFELEGGLVGIEFDLAAVTVPNNWPDDLADIAVITLPRDAPPELPRYALYGGGDELGRTAVLAGYGITGHGSTGAEQDFDALPTRRAGVNRIDAVKEQLGIEYLAFDFDSGLAENNTFDLTGVQSDLGFGSDEVGLAPGDSGGPMFIGKAIAGVNVSRSPAPVGDANSEHDSSWGELNLATRVSNFRAFLTTATGGKAVFTPEPSTLTLMAFGLVPAAFRRRTPRASIDAARYMKSMVILALGALLTFSLLSRGGSIALGAEYVEIASSPEIQFVFGVSADGHVVMGSGHDSSWGGQRNWIWTRETGRVPLYPNPPFSVFPWAISADGATVVGDAWPITEPGPNMAVRWNGANGTKLLDLDKHFDTSVALGVSRDGSIVAGYGTKNGTSQLFRWTESGGIQTLPNSINTWGGYLSDDGASVAGVSKGRAILWNELDGRVDLGVLSGAGFSEPHAIAGNGAVVVGESGVIANDEYVAQEAFRWTKETAISGLGYLPGLVQKSIARDATFDGSVIVGSSGNQQPFRNGDTKGFVWDSVNGMRDLEHVLRTDHGLTNVPRNSLELPWAISDDGKTIVGWTRNVSQGNISRFTAWAIFLDKPLVSIGIPGDFNADGMVDAADYVVWREGLGTTYAQHDYDVWRANFGQTAAAAATIDHNISADPLAAVPEPETLKMLFMAMVGILSRCRVRAPAAGTCGIKHQRAN